MLLDFQSFLVLKRNVIKKQFKLDDILNSYKFEDSFIKEIVKFFRDSLKTIHVNVYHKPNPRKPILVEDIIAKSLLSNLEKYRNSISHLKNIISSFNSLISMLNSEISLGDVNKITAIRSFIYADKSKEEYDKINWLNLGVEALEKRKVSIYSIPIPRDSLEGKVLYIDWGLPGGIKTYLDILINNLSKMQPKLKPIRASYTHDNGYSGNIEEDLKNADIINIHNFTVGWPNSLIYKRLKETKNKKPIVYTAHGFAKSELKEIAGFSEDQANNAPAVIAEKNLLQLADVIVLNSYLYEKMKQEYPKFVKNEKIVIIEPSSDIWKYKDSSINKHKSEKSANKKNFFILYHGRITPTKGTMELVKAIHELKNVYLMMAGPTYGPKYNDELLKAIASENVRIKGVDNKNIIEIRNIAEHLLSEGRLTYFKNIENKKELAKLIQTADLCIQPTFYDSFNISLLECVLLGTPILTTKGSGPDYYFKNVAIRVNWPESFDQRVNNLKKGIETAIEKYDMLKEITMKWRKYYILKHHPYVFFNKYARLYQELLEDKHSIKK